MIHAEDRPDSLGPAVTTRDVDHEQHGDPRIVMPMRAHSIMPRWGVREARLGRSCFARLGNIVDV